jgi:hypothetical protein
VIGAGSWCSSRTAGTCGAAARWPIARSATDLVALAPAGDGHWRTQASGDLLRLCENYTAHDVCNWTVADGEDATAAACGLSLEPHSAPVTEKLRFVDASIAAAR